VSDSLGQNGCSLCHGFVRSKVQTSICKYSVWFLWTYKWGERTLIVLFGWIWVVRINRVQVYLNCRNMAIDVPPRLTGRKTQLLLFPGQLERGHWVHQISGMQDLQEKKCCHGNAKDWKVSSALQIATQSIGVERVRFTGENETLSPVDQSALNKS